MIFRHPTFGRIFSFIVLLAFLNYTASCTYYKSRGRPVASNPVIDLGDQNNPARFIFIVHFGEEILQLSAVKLDRASNKIFGKFSRPDAIAMAMYDNIQLGQTKRYHKYASQHIRQVHLFIEEYEVLGDNEVVIYGDQIQKMEILDLAAFPTILSYVVSAAAIFWGVLILYLLIFCSCPHVYIHDGEKYVFDATLFTGAISANIERHDYKILPDYFPDAETYSFKVLNEEQEQQFTNQLELLVAYHDNSSSVWPNSGGELYLVKTPHSPLLAVSSGNKDRLPLVAEADDAPFLFDGELEDGLSALKVSFEKKGDLPLANLLLRVRNSKWGGFVYKDFISMFGSYYGKWSEKSQNKPGHEITQWALDQGILLSVDIKIQDQWVAAGNVDLVGEAGYASLAVPLDLAAHYGDTVEVRLRSGYMFWELDYVGLDFQPQPATGVHRLAPAMAAGNNSEDFAEALATDDNLYMEHLEKGSSAEIEFGPIAPAGNQSRTIILHSKGYYKANYTLEGKPQLKQLRKFKTPRQLSFHSKTLHDQLSKYVTVNQITVGE